MDAQTLLSMGLQNENETVELIPVLISAYCKLSSLLTSDETVHIDGIKMNSDQCKIKAMALGCETGNLNAFFELALFLRDGEMVSIRRSVNMNATFRSKKVVAMDKRAGCLHSQDLLLKTIRSNQSFGAISIGYTLQS